MTNVPALSASCHPRLARHARLGWDPTRERPMLLAPEGVVALNGTGEAILTLCDGQRTLAEIVATLGERYNRVLDDEVENFLTRLATRGWVGLADE